jgi:Na+/H+-dicarboxylate symporter
MRKQPIYKALYFQVLMGVLLGIAVGHYWPDFGASLKPLGDAFVKLVKMMIAPVVFCTIVSGVASLNDSKEVGKTMLKSMGIFYALTIIALLIGWAAVALIEPGVGMHINPAQLDASVVTKYSKAEAGMGFVAFMMHIIPNSFFGAFAEGEVLPVLLLAILFGFGLTRIGKAGELAHSAIESFASALFAIFGFIMKLAPIGAFGAMAFTVGKYGVGSIGSLGMLIVTFYVACIFFVVVILGALARIHGFSLWKLLRYVREELLVVLGTSSSEPVLPRLLQKLQQLGCKKGVVGLVLPMGYSFNLDGTAIYLTLASLFIAQACDIHLGTGQILTMLGVMLLTSKGAAGVTGSGFVALVATLTVMPDLPVAGVAIIVGIDRFMSEARALTSTISNVVVSVVVSIWENACDRKVLQTELDSNYLASEQALEDISEEPGFHTR